MPSPTGPPSGAGRSSADAPPHPVPAVKVERKIQVAATPTEAFAKLSDVKVLASLLTGLMDWTATDEPNRFRTVFRAGPAPLGGEIELAFWPEPSTVTWQPTRGVHQMGPCLGVPRDDGQAVRF